MSSYRLNCSLNLTSPALVDVEISRVLRREPASELSKQLREEKLVFLYRLRNQVATPLLPMFGKFPPQKTAALVIEGSSGGTTERSHANENRNQHAAQRSESVGHHPAPVPS